MIYYILFNIFFLPQIHANCIGSINNFSDNILKTLYNTSVTQIDKAEFNKLGVAQKEHFNLKVANEYRAFIHDNYSLILNSIKLDKSPLISPIKELDKDYGDFDFLLEKQDLKSYVSLLTKESVPDNINNAYSVQDALSSTDITDFQKQLLKDALVYIFNESFQGLARVKEERNTFSTNDIIIRHNNKHNLTSLNFTYSMARVKDLTSLKYDFPRVYFKISPSDLLVINGKFYITNITFIQN